MLIIKTPQKYINEPGVINNAGNLIKEYGDRLYILGGKNSFDKTYNVLRKSLDAAGLVYKTAVLDGYPTRENFKKHAREAKEFGADVFVAVGGGKVCDTSKSAAALAGITCVTIPTIAATCAAWAALSVVYNDQGRVISCDFHQTCPKLVIADTQVILNAPSRYLKAGIIDTLAKWYETAPNLAFVHDDITLDVNTNTAKEAYDVLIRNLDKTIDDIENHRVTKETTDAVDAVIYLAGLSGGLTSANNYGGFAHGFYNSITQLKCTTHMLHGERVALGLLTQFVVEERSKEELDREMEIFVKLGQPLTLAQVGVTENKEQAAALIAPDIKKFVSFVPFLKENKNLDRLEEFMLKADAIGQTYYA